MPEGGFEPSNSHIFNGNEFADMPLKIENDKAIREECKRILIRKSTIEHNGHPYLETVEQIDGMDIEDVRKKLDEIKRDNVAS